MREKYISSEFNIIERASSPFGGKIPAHRPPIPVMRIFTKASKDNSDERFKAAMTTQIVKCRGGIEREQRMWIHFKVTLLLCQ